MFGGARVIGDEAVEIAPTRLCYSERNRVMGCAEDVGAVGRRREDEISGEREKVLESERERAFESGKDGVDEVVRGMGEVVEEEASHGAADNPQHVEETQGEMCGRN